MLEEVVPGVLVGSVLIVCWIVYYKWFERTPPPDGLYAGEKLVSSARATLRIDDSFVAARGFAYLTDLRLVWTPNTGFWFGRGLVKDTPLAQHVILEFGSIRRADASYLLTHSRLRVECADIRVDLTVKGRSLESWERHIKSNARHLLLPDEPLASGNRRYPDGVFKKASKGAAVVFALLVFFFAVRLLDLVVGALDQELTDRQLIGVVLLFGCGALALFVWETRRI